VRSWGVAALAAGALLLTGCGGGSDAHLVTANSIGPVRLGEPRGAVEPAMGPGKTGHRLVQRYGQLAGWTFTTVHYPRARLSVVYATRPGGAPFAAVLMTGARMYASEDGGRVGDSVQQLHGLFGMHCYGSPVVDSCFQGQLFHGVGFMIDHDRATAIDISASSPNQIAVWAADA
jgi:hypothetical protein